MLSLVMYQFQDINAKIVKQNTEETQKIVKNNYNLTDLAFVPFFTPFCPPFFPPFFPPPFLTTLALAFPPTTPRTSL